jgi:hypothetical protein
MLWFFCFFLICIFTCLYLLNTMKGILLTNILWIYDSNICKIIFCESQCTIKIYTHVYSYVCVCMCVCVCLITFVLFQTCLCCFDCNFVIIIIHIGLCKVLLHSSAIALEWYCWHVLPIKILQIMKNCLPVSNTTLHHGFKICFKKH